MMPHAGCSQADCWLSKFLAAEHIPAPRFHFGQSIKHTCWSEAGDQCFVDQGVVIGVLWNPPHSSPGWWYLIRWDVLPSSPWLSIPHVEESSEQGLASVFSEQVETVIR